MLWVRAFHLIGLFVWMGGLLFLTMLLARAAADPDGSLKDRLFALARRMYFRVTLPGLGIAFTMGVLLIVDSIQNPADPERGSVFKQGWFHAKLLGVIILLAVDHLLMRAVKKGPAGATPGRFHALHGVTALLLITIVVLTKVVA